MKRFLRTRIGISLIIFLAIVGTAAAMKLKESPLKNPIGSTVSLIAQESIKSAIENGQIETPDWEATLASLSTTSIEQQIALLQTNAPSEEAELTPTDRFSREFFTRYIELKESGAAIDEHTGTSLITELLSRDYGDAQKETVYSVDDITILDTDSSAQIKAYGNMLGAIFLKPVPPGYISEILLIGGLGQEENTEDFQKLALNVERYGSMRDDMLALPVPRALRHTHVAMINAFSAMIDGIKGIILVEKDPVGATKEILRYEDGITALPLVLDSLKGYFKDRKITFSQTESGYVLTQ